MYQQFHKKNESTPISQEFPDIVQLSLKHFKISKRYQYNLSNANLLSYKFSPNKIY